VTGREPLDLVLRGEAYDPAGGLRGMREIGIRDGTIAAVERTLESWPRRETLAFPGCLISPGFVDIHAHIYAGVCSWGTKADPGCLPSGVTTVVDAGSAGWPMLQGFRWYVHERSAVRALCFLHISGIGLVNAYVGECEDIRHLDPRTVGESARENRDLVVGIKVRQGAAQVGQWGTEPLRRAVAAAEIAGLPVMCHIGAGVPLPDVLALLRPGDILTHCFQGRGEERENLTDARGRLLPEAREARARGVIMDVGHGGGSFRWEVAEAALEQGFLPDVISTDLHAYNLHGPLFDMATTLTKLLHLGVPLETAIAAATAVPAQVIGRPELGTLAAGAPADLAVFRLADEPVELWDTHRQLRRGTRRLRVEATIRAGAVYRPHDLDGETPEEITRRCRWRGDDRL